MKPLERIAYGAGQLARTAWFTGQSLAAAVVVPVPPNPRRGPSLPVPSTAAILGDLRQLYRQDWANIQAGHYPLPWDLKPNVRQAARRSRQFFADLPRVQIHRRSRDGQDVPDTDEALPRYFRQAFHYQTDGYLSAHSAELYDAQVETLFVGGADAMRRQALPPLVEHLSQRPTARVADIACGTGRFLRFVRQALPRAELIGVDLSRPYLQRAATHHGAARARLVQANAEALPLAGLDAASCVFLLHELPRAARARVAASLAASLAPGGRLVVVDSIQPGDHPPYDGLLARFADTFHEPYHRDYCADDLVGLFTATGLTHRTTTRAFFAKVMVFDRV